MELATAAVSTLLTKLGALLLDEYKLHKGVRGEIRFLQAEMESMQAALNWLSKQPAHQIDELNKIWVRDLKELVYDIEDSVDAFKVRVDNDPEHAKPHWFTRFFDRTIGLLTKAKNRHHIVDDIQDIKKRIDDVSKRKKRYSSLGAGVQPDTVNIDPRMASLYQDAAKLVGIDGPTQELVDLLTRGEGVKKQKLKVVSIVGVGGLGKTTIANSVYETLKGQFECQAFVSVSLKPDMKQILSSILQQVCEDKCANAREKDPNELIRSIKKFLVDKRYLIVIDDVWSVEAWETIKYALIDKNVGSRVIVTTRNMDVAKFSSMDGEVYELDPLSDEDSRSLLCKRIFNEDDGIYSDLEEVTKKILKKCGGIPLAIITTASMLDSMPNRTKYEWYGVYNSMGSGLEEDKTLDNMRNILHLSYSDMPSYLKPCLLYLSLFPEDFTILRRDLVRLWVAEGFVDGKKGDNLYDTGERYFNELVNRSMIQPYINEVGVAEACRVHDMILDLIISISELENFAFIAEGQQLKSTVCKIRRIALQGEVDGIGENNKEEQMLLPTTANISHARSLIVFGNVVQLMPPLSSFSILRVLCLKKVSSKIIDPKSLGSLHHLRYLELGGEVEPGLLEGIGNLKHLKILYLWSPFVKKQPTSIVQLPTSIVQLQGLEHLLIGGNVVLTLPDGIGNLTALQELSVLNVRRSPNTLAELGKLTELRALTIKGFSGNESHVKTFLEGLSNLENLRTLEFTGIFGELISLDSMSDPWRGPAHLQSFNGDDYLTFSALPWWFSFLSELSCLSIRVKVLRQVDLQLLGALPVLRFLKLQVDHDGITEKQLVIDGDRSFRSLAEFKFKHYSRCWLVFGPGAMPKLQELELYFEAWRREGGGLDVGLENLTSLKHVTVEVHCASARAREVVDVETRIRNAIYSHPNHPTLQLSRVGEIHMKRDENNDVRESSQQQRKRTRSGEGTSRESSRTRVEP